MDSPLKVEVKGGQLTISIGIDRLAYCAEHCPLFYQYPDEYDPPFKKVEDAKQLAEDVANELMHDRGDGATRIDLLLDECIKHAYEGGSIAFGSD